MTRSGLWGVPKIPFSIYLLHSKINDSFHIFIFRLVPKKKYQFVQTASPLESFFIIYANTSDKNSLIKSPTLKRCQWKSTKSNAFNEQRKLKKKTCHIPDFIPKILVNLMASWNPHLCDPHPQTHIQIEV